MTTLSLAMIVRDSQDMIERCLNSVVGLCDELVVVDTGSIDGTVESARRMGAQVYEFEWIDDFAAARNRSFQLCTGDWILWLDSDDTISDSSLEALIKLKNSACTDQIDAIFLPYKYSIDEFGNCRFLLYRERLLRRQAAPQWQSPVHECIATDPQRSMHVHDVFIEHRPTKKSLLRKPKGRNLKILEKAVNSENQNARILFYYANELYENGQVDAAISQYEKFLEVGDQSWAKYYAMRRLSASWLKAEDDAKALEWARRAIAAEPERAEAYVDAGIIHLKRSQTELAIPFFSRATELKVPTTSFIDLYHYGWLPYDHLSACYLAQEEYSKALEAGIAALERNPDDARLKENVEFLRSIARISV